MSTTQNPYAELQTQLLASVRDAHPEWGEETLDRYAARLRETIERMSAAGKSRHDAEGGGCQADSSRRSSPWI